jgi:hypothetical protein
MKSWKTTLLGLATAMAGLGLFAKAYLDNDPSTMPDATLLVAEMTAALGLIFARDNDKSSEDAGAK